MFQYTHFLCRFFRCIDCFSDLDLNLGVCGSRHQNTNVKAIGQFPHVLYLLVAVDVDDVALQQLQQQTPRRPPDPVDVQVVAALGGSCDIPRDTGARRCQHACMCMPSTPTIVVSHKGPYFRIASRASHTITCHKVDVMASCVGYNINVPSA